MIQLGRVLARLRLVATQVAVPKKIAMAVEKEFGRKGKLFDPSKVRLRLGRPNECHKNSSKLFYLVIWSGSPIASKALDFLLLKYGGKTTTETSTATATSTSTSTETKEKQT